VSIDQQAVLVNSAQGGFNDRLGDRILFRPQRPAEAVAELDGLAQPGTALIEASALLLDEIGQTFGVPEMGQFSRTGQVRRPYWGVYRSQIEAWAAQHPIEVTDDTFGPTG
jgi:hypothetical protein